MKPCTKCKQVKPFSEFRQRSDRRSLLSWCNGCMLQSSREAHARRRLPIRDALNVVQGYVPPVDFLEMGPTEGGALVASVGCMVEARRRAA